jgi:hypothetical protein
MLLEVYYFLFPPNYCEVFLLMLCMRVLLSEKYKHHVDRIIMHCTY